MGTWCRVIAVRRSGQYAVIGLGRFGSRVAAGLYNAGAEVIAIDTDPHNVDAVKADVTTAVTMDATSKDALRSLALDELDAVVVAIGRDTEASILVTALLRELGCKRIVARAGSNLHADILRRVGATQVVYPEDDIAAGLVRSLASRGSSTWWSWRATSILRSCAFPTVSWASLFANWNCETGTV